MKGDHDFLLNVMIYYCLICNHKWLNVLLVSGNEVCTVKISWVKDLGVLCNIF